MNRLVQNGSMAVSLTEVVVSEDELGELDKELIGEWQSRGKGVY